MKTVQTAENQRESAKKAWWKHLFWMAPLGLALVLVGVASGYFWHYQNRALPNTAVAGVDVSGMTTAEAQSALEQKFKSLTPEVVFPAKTVTATYEDLGATAQMAQAAQNAVAKSSWTEYLQPWQKRNFALAVTVDEAKLTKFANSHLEPTQQTGKVAQISLREDASGFDIKPSETGKRPDLASLAKEVESAAQNLKAPRLEVIVTDQDPVFTTAAAEAIVATATKQLNTKVALAAPSYKYTPSVERKRSFFTINTAEDGTANIVLNKDAVAQWVKAVIDDVNTKPRNGTQHVDASGKPVGEVIKPKAGVEVTNSDELLGAAIAAYANAKETSAEVKVKAIPGKVETVPLPANISAPTGPLAYSAAAGEKWIDINLSRHTITPYVGNTPVRLPSLMVNGKPGHETVTGTFKVRAKVREQTMRGPDYVTPRVPWVLYFHGDYAIHGAYWRSNFGYAGRNGSHGCVNLPPATAKWFFNWANVGTTVVSHY